MAGETALSVLLRSLEPRLDDGDYVFCTLVSDAPTGCTPVASIREAEGLSLILPREQADARDLPYDYVAAWITLQVHSSLAAVGLTAAVAAALAQADISCNVVAGYHHDHLFVPRERAECAVSILRALAASAVEG
ncbi:ACT domain-containing protein [Pseudomonas otitidis]|uniref:ACT domain-containing protein n=1 Tax=Metapseudomonas otitidis TaxID=319939 RepID=A0ABU3XTP3_9GAMM|nr:ACT domain-containing protein [Pseudomonas otitidis]MDV3441300.1 ACT domain-containing protein [Pseudomonas otitidis]MEE1895906.1 ACT domain-containing protein [Pseudomonas otitidis]WMR32452.1 ACT domain-containing protein [Pseudomonas otitidis]